MKKKKKWDWSLNIHILEMLVTVKSQLQTYLGKCCVTSKVANQRVHEQGISGIDRAHMLPISGSLSL